MTMSTASLRTPKQCHTGRMPVTRFLCINPLNRLFLSNLLAFSSVSLWLILSSSDAGIRTRKSLGGQSPLPGLKSDSWKNGDWLRPRCLYPFFHAKIFSNP